MLATKWMGALALVGLLLLAACAPEPRRPPAPPAAAAPSGFPEAFYRAAAARGLPVYRIEPGGSEVVVYVYRGGPLSRFGHDHVVSTGRVQGFALLSPDPAVSRADLFLALGGMVVDDSVMRDEAGFETSLDATEIEGTRRNMLEKVLEADRYPFATVHVETGDTASTLDITLKLHGRERRLQVPAQFEISGRELLARGRFPVRQTDFNITPFSLLGGALRVQDEIAIRFDIRGRRWR